jgi:hypothetical protein
VVLTINSFVVLFAERLWFSIFIFVIMNIQNKVLLWNCKGAASNSFYRYCKQYVDLHKPVILVVVNSL